ncbi:MAG: hypothetical protein AAFU67_03740, partial [Bacteroidota bacterium]
MLKRLSTTLLLCWPVFVWSQLLLPELQSTMEEIPCPYDSTITVTQSTRYQFYHTQDDSYTGAIDSSFCANFTLDPTSNRYYLDLSNIDLTRPLFMGIDFPVGEFPLEPYQNYLFTPNVWLDDASLTVEDSCTGAFCSGLFVEYDFFDQVSEQFGTRLQSISSNDDYPETEGSCFFTDRFVSHELRRLVFK